MTNPTRTAVGARASAAAEEALEATTHAIDSSRQFAAEAAGKIGDAARDLRDEASDLARAAAESVADATLAAQREMGSYARAGRRYVARQPLKSALIAAAVGAVAAALIMAARSRRDGD